MDPSDLLLFDAIMREGSITGAARKLGEPKATVSRRLQRLEKAAGASLFDRTSRWLRPTPLGESLVAPASAIRIALADAKSLADATRLEESGRLRIASPFLFGRLVLAPFVGRFIAQRTNLNVTLKFTNEPVNPLRDGFDLAIQITEPKADYLVTSKLASADLKLYAAPHIAASIVNVNDLRQYQAIKTSNDPTDALTLILSGGSQIFDVSLTSSCTVNDPEAACYIASKGNFVAALPAFIAHRFVETGALLPVLPHISAGHVKIFLVTPPGRLSVPLVRSFLTELKDELTDQQFARLPPSEPLSTG